MNAFVEHHQDSIRFSYSCFDRIVLNGIIQVLQSLPTVVWFLRDKRQVPVLTATYFRSVSNGYHSWIQELARGRGIPIVEPPKGERRDEFVEPFFQQHSQPGIAVILKSRENARYVISKETQGAPHIEFANRFVWQYYFYIRDADMGCMFIRICPYFPFNTRICINGHEWLACQMRREDIPFQQCGNAFLDCANPARLQQLADQFAPQHIQACVHRWLAQLVPFFSDAERRREGYGYRLFMSQVEYCTNLVFHERAALERMMERLLDLNRTIGRPDKLAYIYGKRLSPQTVEGIKTQISDYHQGNPAIRSNFRHCAVKQYVRDNVLLRMENLANSTYDLGVNKDLKNLPQLRQAMGAVNERYLDIQQDVLETFVDRGQLARLREATVSPSGRRTPGIKLDDPRLLAVMQALTRFANLAAGGTFRTRDLHGPAAAALGRTTETYTLAQLRYDLGKLRAKGLVEKVTGTQSYRLTPEGYRLCVLFLKLFHRVYAPLTAGILDPVAADDRLPEEHRSVLCRLYAAVDRTLHDLFDHLGLKPAA